MEGQSLRREQSTRFGQPRTFCRPHAWQGFLQATISLMTTRDGFAQPLTLASRPAVLIRSSTESSMARPDWIARPANHEEGPPLSAHWCQSLCTRHLLKPLAGWLAGWRAVCGEWLS